MKRFLTSILALVFLLSSASIALAAPLDEEDDIGTGDGSVVTIGAVDRFKATLPTSEGFKFSIDPHGIFNLTNEQIEKLTVGSDGIRLGKNADIPCTTVDCPEGCDDGDESSLDPCTFEEGGGAWAPLPTAGQVLFTEGFAPLALNESNFDVSFKIDFQIVETDSAATPDPTDKITPVATVGAVANSGTPCSEDDCEDHKTGDADKPCNAVAPANNLFIAAVFSTDLVTSKDVDSFSGDLALPITKTVKSPEFLLEAMPYSDKIEVEGVGDARVVTVEQKAVKVAADGIGNGTQFMMFGRCNPIADWNILTLGGDAKTQLSITIGYTIDDAGDLADEDDIAGAAGLKEANGLDGDDFVTQALTSDLEPGAKVGFIVGGAIVETRAAITAPRGWIAIPFDAGGGTAVMTIDPSSLTTGGLASSNHNVANGTVDVNISTGGWRTLVITVDGTKVFKVDILAT